MPILETDNAKRPVMSDPRGGMRMMFLDSETVDLAQMVIRSHQIKSGNRQCQKACDVRSQKWHANEDLGLWGHWPSPDGHMQSSCQSWEQTMPKGLWCLIPNVACEWGPWNLPRWSYVVTMPILGTDNAKRPVMSDPRCGMWMRALDSDAMDLAQMVMEIWKQNYVCVCKLRSCQALITMIVNFFNSRNIKSL